MTETTNKVNQSIDFLNLHFTPDTDMFSFIKIGCRQQGYSCTYNAEKHKMRKQKRGIYPCGYFKTDEIQSLAPGAEYAGYFKPMGLIKSLATKRDYYITANGFNSASERNSGHLFTLHNIVIDIDCHAKLPEKEFNMAMSSCLYFLEDLFREYDFPSPNTIVNTGRGFQLWWAIDPVSAKAKKVYDVVRKYIIDRINELLDNIPTLKLFKLDKSASKNYVGYYRFPGSYNSAAGKFGSFNIINKEKLDIFEFARSISPVKVYNINDVKRTYASYSIKGLDTYREKMLYNLLELRDGDAEGCRDLMCLILCNAYLSSGRSREDATEAVLRLNRNFNKPMNERHLISYMSSSFEKKYLFTNEKIIEVLDISKTEQRKLCFYATKDSKRIRDEKRQAKTERNEKIVELFEQGKTQIEIAEEVGCSQPTVCRAIKKYEIAREAESVKTTVIPAKDILANIRRIKEQASFNLKKFMSKVKEGAINKTGIPYLKTWHKNIRNSMWRVSLGVP